MHKSAMIIVMEYKLKEQKKKKIRIPPLVDFMTIKTKNINAVYLPDGQKDCQCTLLAIVYNDLTCVSYM